MVFSHRWRFIGIAVTVILTAAILALPVQAAEPAPATPHPETGYDDCSLCHGPTGSIPTPESHLDYGQIPCLTCHPRETVTPVLTTEGQTDSIHQPTRECQTCHPEEFTEGQDSIHTQQLEGGNTAAPTCSDCHGSGPVVALDTKTAAAAACAKCHADVYQTYRDSVHGAALIGDGNSDVPACSDCHQAHDVVDPETPAFRLESVDICAECHGNAELMERYGISTNVITSYLNDFHGATVALVEKEDRDVWVEEAVCTDCHGIHDIQAVDDPDSRVIKENLVATCEECHPGATENFPSAWLSHYEPTAKEAPLVFLVKLFYWIMIPFILIGLSVHIGLDLWRARKHR